MTAAAEIAAEPKLLDAREVLEIRAHIRAFLWWHYIIGPCGMKGADGKWIPDGEWIDEERAYAEGLQEAVDPLQEYAERSGLVEAIGQDAVQTIIAAPFAKLQKKADALEIEALTKSVRAAEAIKANPQKSDRAIAQEIGVSAMTVGRVREAAGVTNVTPARTGQDGNSIRQRAYCTPRSTLNAFLYVARNESTEYLARWLKDHPLDAPQLRKLWTQKCTAP
jgi:hypothetical protein